MTQLVTGCLSEFCFFCSAEERMQDLVSKMLQLVQKIPDFIKADKEILSNLKGEMDEGVKESTRNQCDSLYIEVKLLQMKLDCFYFLHIHVSF